MPPSSVSAHQLHAAHRELGGAHAILRRAGIAFGAGQRMDVAVDHARDQRAARGVDLLAGEARELPAGATRLTLPPSSSTACPSCTFSPSNRRPPTYNVAIDPLPS